MPPYEGYPPQGYGGYPTYGQTQVSPNQNQRSIPMQQGHPAVVTPSSQNQQVPSRAQSWQQPQVNYQQPHQQYQAYHQAPQPQYYQQSSPLQQFVSGNLQAPNVQQYQQPWIPQRQQVDYQVPYQPSQRPSQAQRQQLLPHQAPRQAPGPSPAPRVEISPSQVSKPHPPTQRNPQQRNPSQPYPPRPSQAPISQPQQPRPSQPPQYQDHQRPPPLNTSAQRTPKQSQQAPRAAPQPSSVPCSISQQRTTAYVQIPVHRMSEMAPITSKPQSRSPKRRRSNEGTAIHVTPAHGQPSKIAAIKLEDTQPESSPLSELPSSQVPSTPTQGADYQAVLLALSDEYLAAAHAMSTHLCSGKATEAEWDQYHQMVSTAMGCLESVLANYRQSDPSKEARIRLRLAMLVFEETENTEELDVLLSKGIEHCDRFRLINAKYAMKHLSLRAQFRTSPKAAYKAAEKAIADVQAQGLHRWVYAFRLLRISFSVQTGGPAETTSTLRHLAALTEEADAQQQVAVQVVAAVLESMVHLRSGSSEAVEQAQRSLTAARTHQLAPEMQQLSQLRAAMDCMDLACSLAQYVPGQNKTKMDHLHENLDATTKSVGWAKDGTFLVPLCVVAEDGIEADTGAIFRKTPSGELALSFTWLSRSQLYMIGYVLSGLSLMGQAIEKRRAEQFFTAGLKLNNAVADLTHMSVAACEAMNEMQESTSLTLRLLLIFTYCGRSDWTAAADAINEIRHDIANMELGRDELTTSILLYLGGACKQGLGELDKALELYQSPELVFSRSSKTTSFLTDLRILATLNAIQILRTQPVPAPAKAAALLATLEESCKAHPNKSLQSAFYLLQAHVATSGQPMFKVKQHLQAAMTPAQAVKNNQLMSIIMSTMTELFFKGIVGKQAMASATAGKELAARTKDPLMGLVADGLFRDTLEREGNVEGAAVVDRQVRARVGKLPEEAARRLGLRDS